jgi:hypothetical protein
MIERGYVGLALGFDWSLFQRGIAAVLTASSADMSVPWRQPQ